MGLLDLAATIEPDGESFHGDRLTGKDAFE